MGLFKNYINQTRKPEGVLGKAMLNGMNSGHAKMADWGMSYLNISSPERIADIGCGGGVNVYRFLQMTDNIVYGLDYSMLACEKSMLLNEDAICEGRCEIIHGSVSRMPFGVALM